MFDQLNIPSSSVKQKFTENSGTIEARRFTLIFIHFSSPYCPRQHLANNVKQVDRGDEEKRALEPHWGLGGNKSRPSAN